MGARERSGAFPVDVQVADVEPPSRLLDAVAISCEDRTGQAELRAVRDVERVGEVARADDREHRPEDLLLRDARAWADAVEDRRLDVVAAFARTTAEHERALRAGPRSDARPCRAVGAAEPRRDRSRANRLTPH